MTLKKETMKDIKTGLKQIKEGKVLSKEEVFGKGKMTNRFKVMTTEKIIEVSEECGYDEKWMKKEHIFLSEHQEQIKELLSRWDNFKKQNDDILKKVMRKVEFVGIDNGVMTLRIKKLVDYELMKDENTKLHQKIKELEGVQTPQYTEIRNLKQQLQTLQKELNNEIHKSSTYFQEKLKLMKEKDNFIKAITELEQEIDGTERKTTKEIRYWRTYNQYKPLHKEWISFKEAKLKIQKMKEEIEDEKKRT